MIMKNRSVNQLDLFLEKPAIRYECDEIAMWDTLQPELQAMPHEYEEVWPGLKWGYFYQLYTPAFWKLQYLLNVFPEEEDAHRITTNILEEVVLCLLGGFGIPSEIGLVAFERLKYEMLIAPGASFEQILEALARPFVMGGEKNVRYRFANQKAKYVHEFLDRGDLDYIPQHDDLQLRDWLMGLKGIGPKTASWITRNWLRSERVAILDIHLLRAGIITGFFHRDFDINTEYYDLENKYLAFCKSLDVRPSNMDAIIWSYMKKNNKLALNILSSIT
jgi:thermostable 8-oxoguanine DNA glycosylase